MKEFLCNIGKFLERNRRINKLVADDDDDWDFGGACGYGVPNNTPSGPGCGYTWEDVEGC